MTPSMPMIIALVAAALSLLALTVTGVALVRAERRGKLLHDRVDKLTQARQQMADIVEGLAAGAVDQGDQVVRLERDIRRLREQITTLASRDTGEGAFNQAIRMASRGTSREDIMETCGLSAVEADLILRIHQKEH